MKKTDIDSFTLDTEKEEWHCRRKGVSYLIARNGAVGRCNWPLTPERLEGDILDDITRNFYSLNHMLSAVEAYFKRYPDPQPRKDYFYDTNTKNKGT